MNNALRAKILYEINQIDKLLGDCTPLFNLCKIKEPDFIELSACAMILHSFYNGIEGILTLVFKHYDGKLPNSNKWHNELLEKAFMYEEPRGQLFDVDLKNKMEEYLKFRHFVRHSYSFQLEWERMKDLFLELGGFWISLKENINRFIENN